MESQRYAFELFAAPQAPSKDASRAAAPAEAGAPVGSGAAAAAVSTHDLVLFFHRVIQEKALSETCIDVTDYSHVPGGPGVMLLCHEAHYSLAPRRGGIGLRCATKRGAEGDVEARVRRVLQKTLRAAAVLETHEVFGGRLSMDTRRGVLSIEDRLLAPNEEPTFAAFAPILARVVTEVWGASPVLARVGTPKECFQIELEVPTSPPISDLLSRL